MLGVALLGILIKHDWVSCEGDFLGYLFALAASVVWVRRQDVLFTHDDCLCRVEGIMRCLSRDVTVIL